MRAIVKQNKKTYLKGAFASFFILVPFCEPAHFTSVQPAINKLYVAGAAAKAEGNR